MKSTVEEMFDAYANNVPELNEKPQEREKAFAAFVAGVMLTTKVIKESKNHTRTTKILKGLDFECHKLAVEHMEAILRKVANDN